MDNIPENLLYQLHQVIGLNPASINAQALHNAVERRMQVRSVDDVAAYVCLLRKNTEELQQLVESVVVPETSFFRHSAAFLALQRLMMERPSRRHWRILCLPCSTGEEPWSVAMCLLQAGWTAEQFSVDAVDISRQALAQAERAIYADYSFRGEMAHQYLHFFTKTPQGYVLRDEVRLCVRFHQGNILDTAGLKHLGTYPIIFCRNLLIYLHAEARKKAAKNISRLLERDGTLFTGNAENAQVWHGMFRSRRIPLAFAMCHPERQQDTHAFSSRQIRQQIMQAAQHQQPSPAAPQEAVAGKPDEYSLKAIRMTANQGDLEAVHRLCRQRLRENPNCAETYFYQALACEAQGQRMKAVGILRQAVYLRPDYAEALQHLALLLDIEGQTEAAARVRHRLQGLNSC